MSKRKVLTDEMRLFISDCFSEGMKINEVLKEFKDEYDFVPSASTLNKYKAYRKLKEEEEEVDREIEKTKKEIKEGDKLEIITKDTRKVKRKKGEGIIDFSDGNVSDEDIALIAELRDCSKAEVFFILKSAYRKGYTKIDLKKMEILK